ncbi:O-antigen translocase [Flavobacterium filum]|uniref:O-antigen translocase n=1 Tax=Flavobacterium filum TaxID=370974 RepID=UPI00146D3668|nr:O-antigen translocase [Flavobacterium filum]
MNSFAIFLRIGFGLVISKVLAIYVGPTGMALVGNLRNFQTSLESFATLGFQNGIVKYTAQFKGDTQQFKKLISTVTITILTSMLLFGIGLFVFKEAITSYLFSSENDFEIIFKAIIFSLPFYGFSLFFTSLINGLEKYKKVVYISIIGNIIGFVFSLFLVLNYNILGALLAMVLAPTANFFVATFFVCKEIKLFQFITLKSFDKLILKNLCSYSAMALFSAIAGPMIYIFLRNHLIDTAGLEEAGYWESITRISTYYMLFVSSLMSMYFLPQLAISSEVETKTIFRNYFKTIVPLFFVGIVLLYFCRNFIISILFTNEFQPVSGLFLWQLLGDFFKVCSWILALNFLAKRQTLAFFVTEIFSYSLLILTGYFMISYFKAKGSVLAHAITYFGYFILLLIVIRKKYKNNTTKLTLN